MIQLKKTGLVVDREDVELLRSQFEKTHLVRIPGLVDPELLTLARTYIEQGQWKEQEYERAGFHYEHVLKEGAAVNLLHFVCNAPRFLEVIGEITGFPSLSWFGGWVYRMEPNASHTTRWHDDCKDGRLVAMSLDLSARVFEGGLMQMRKRNSRRTLVDVANTGPGDAILFRISKDLEHHVTGVQGAEPKTAFAGWFSYKETMRERIGRDPTSSGAVS